MLNKKTQGSNRPPVTKKLSTSARVGRITREYVEDAQIGEAMAEAYMTMRPKSFGEINFKLFKLSKKAVIPLHVLSFIICLPFFCIILYLVLVALIPVSMFPTGFEPIISVLHCLVAFVVSVLFVGKLEEWQHVVLSGLFETYYIDGLRISYFYVLLSMFFCAISVVLALFGLDIVEYKIDNIPEVFKRYRYPIAALALLVEGLIVFATWFYYNYQYWTAKGMEVQNDLYKGIDYVGLNFKNFSTPPPPC